MITRLIPSHSKLRGRKGSMREKRCKGNSSVTTAKIDFKTIPNTVLKVWTSIKKSEIWLTITLSVSWNTLKQSRNLNFRASARDSAAVQRRPASSATNNEHLFNVDIIREVIFRLKLKKIDKWSFKKSMGEKRKKNFAKLQSDFNQKGGNRIHLLEQDKNELYRSLLNRNERH